MKRTTKLLPALLLSCLLLLLSGCGAMDEVVGGETRESEGCDATWDELVAYFPTLAEFPKFDGNIDYYMYSDGGGATLFFEEVDDYEQVANAYCDQLLALGFSEEDRWEIPANKGTIILLSKRTQLAGDENASRLSVNIELFENEYRYNHNLSFDLHCEMRDSLPIKEGE